MSRDPYRRSSSRRKGYRNRRRRKRILSVAIATILILTALGLYLWYRGMFPANQVAQEWYEIKSQRESVLVQLPRDDAPHDNFMEWWYYNGHLDTESGDRYSFHFALFVVNTMVTQSVAHLSLVDQQSGLHYTDQKLTPGRPARQQANGFAFNLGGWQITGGEGKDQLRAGNSNFRLELRMQESSPPVMHGGSGLLNFGAAGTSYYYSRPRMEIQGEIEVAGAIRDVRGVAWFDHQWGDFDVNRLGWDWFALQLEDGSDIMIYLLFDSSGAPVLRTASFTQKGSTRILTATEFEVEASDRWVSERTGMAYPMGWRVSIPSREIDLILNPTIKASEFDARATTNKVYWEGAVEIGGTHNGRGFVELSGYEKLINDSGPTQFDEKMGTIIRR